MNIKLHLKNINLAKKNKYDIIACGGYMKGIICTDIQSLKEQNINVEFVIDEVRAIMEQEYPDYIEWFDNKLVPGLDSDRNIIFLIKNHNIIGFVNLKRSIKENKISNLYIKPSFNYKKHWELIMDKATGWLKDDDPIIILSKKQLIRCNALLYAKNWYISDKRKNDDFIINRPNDIEKIKRILKKKSS